MIFALIISPRSKHLKLIKYDTKLLNFPTHTFVHVHVRSAVTVSGTFHRFTDLTLWLSAVMKLLWAAAVILLTPQVVRLSSAPRTATWLIISQLQ